MMLTLLTGLEDVLVDAGTRGDGDAAPGDGGAHSLGTDGTTTEGGLHAEGGGSGGEHLASGVRMYFACCAAKG